MTPEQQEQVHDLLGKGFGRHVIAREVGIGLGVARHAIDRIKSGPRKPSWWEEQPGRVETLTRLWNDGLVVAAIAEKMGISRNKVIGKAHRLGLKARKDRSPLLSPEERTRRARERQKRRNALRRNPFASVPQPESGPVRKYSRTYRPQPAPKPRPVEVAMPTNPPIRLVDAPMRGICRNIAGEPNGPDTLYCGAEALPGQSWCAYHRLLLYRPREERQRREIYAFKESA